MQAFTFEMEGHTHTIDLTPFGETGRDLGATERLELCATELNRIQVLLGQARYLHARLKQTLLAGYVGKDSEAAKTRFLEATPQYLESRRTRDFLQDALQIMLYGHYPRLRENEKHANEMVRLSSHTARHSHTV